MESNDGKPMQFMLIEDVQKRTRLGETSIRRLMKTGEFPASFKLAATRRAVFIAGEIDEWMAKQVRSREAQ